MRRYKVTMAVSVIVRCDNEEEALGEALKNVHDATILDEQVEEYDECQSTKSTPYLKSLGRDLFG